MHRSARVAGLVAGLLSLTLCSAVQAAPRQQPPPVPHPFPRTGGQSAPPPPSAPPPAAPAQQTAPTTKAAGSAASASGAMAAKLGLPIYPAAQFIASYDAGQGQRYYLFGSTASFSDLVAYYQAVLKKRGTMVFDTPATYMFEVGKFDTSTMAFPPGVTIKDFRSSQLQGYPNPKPGGQPAFFPSIIQIVPVPQQR